MKKHKLLQLLRWLPSFLILIGISLWAYSLFFSPITNHYERKLDAYWKTNFDRSSDLMDTINRNLQLSVSDAISIRPDDKPLLDIGNQIVKLQQAATTELDEKLEHSDTNTYQIVQRFWKETEDLLREGKNAHPLIRTDELTDLFKQIPITSPLRSSKLSYKMAFLKNQIYRNTSAYLNYLSSKIGSICLGHADMQPTITFSETLRAGQSQTGAIFLTYFSSCDFNPKYKVRINGQSLLVKDRVSTFTEVFNDASPKALNVEYEFHQPLFRNHKYVTDTTILKETFIIHPIQK